MLLRLFLAVLVAAASSACLSEADSVPSPSASSTTASTDSPPTSPSSIVETPATTDREGSSGPSPSGTSSTRPTGEVDDLAAASAAFREWVDHLGRGDHPEAWDAMAPTSQAAIGEQVFFDGMVYEMAEGWGSWSAADDVDFRLEQDENGRTLLWVSGTISPEGMTEYREVAVPVVASGGRYLVSPFEEFGNVADAVVEELEGSAAPPVPADSGTGRRVVYSNADQRVWMVGADGSVVDSYLVSGKQGVPAPGEYEVYSRSEFAFAGHDDITMRYMVRFARGDNLPIGFHAIPNDGSGSPLQSEEQLGEYHSAGCVRQSLAHAAALYDWAREGTTVVVLG